MVFGERLDEGEGGLDPNKLSIEVKVRESAINAGYERVTGE